MISGPSRDRQADQTDQAAAPGARPIPADARAARQISADGTMRNARAIRAAFVFSTVAAAFLSISAQLIHLGLTPNPPRASISRPLSETFARPAIVDRSDILLASDVVMQSLYADPSALLDVDEVLTALSPVLPGIDTPALRKALANRRRRFVWLRRGLSPATAQRIHGLGLPGLDFRAEPKRSYPYGRTAGHILGHVNIDNKGTAGVELHIDRAVGVRNVVGSPRPDERRIRLTIDLRAQIALERELGAAMKRYRARAASAVIVDATSGAVRAAASLPSADPANPVEAQHLTYLDRLKRGTYELGSIFKALTIAMALEKRTITTATRFDVSQTIEIGERFRIRDHHPSATPLDVEQIFIRSSNVGAGLIALEVGQPSQSAFLKKLGLLDPLETDAGPTASPQLPAHWGKAELVTISYGHGIAIAPLQFAAAGAALVNGGFAVKPHFVESSGTSGTGPPRAKKRVLSSSTSAAIRRLMRRNVTAAEGTGRRAAATGYDVGGKTGTADMAQAGEYDGDAVVTSFFAAFPMSAPRYVVLVTLHDPAGAGPSEKRYASLNAAPVAGRIIERTAPFLGVAPRTE